jgi:hypothetical protein
MKKLAFFSALLVVCLLFGCKGTGRKNNNYSEIAGGRIYIENNQFFVEGKRIWINGVNTPWNKWNDFGGGFDRLWWINEFKRLRDNGVNAARIWINCDGYGAVTLKADGTFNSVKDSHWTHLDQLFALAQDHGIYIMATLLSFDHFKTGNFQSDRWRAMIQSEEASKSFVDNYTIPFVNRYKDDPWLWSIDIMNEPEWISATEGNNDPADRILWDNISYFLGINAAAIRRNSDILVTVGIASIKYNADGGGFQGNKVSDSYLNSLTKDAEAKLDFWSPHYYDWVGEWYNIPFYRTPALWRLPNTKPAVIGECSAKGIGNNWSNKYSANSGIAVNNILNDYENAYNNGWQGVMAWTSNGVDSNGNINNLKPATLNMLEKYPSLVYPLN